MNRQRICTIKTDENLFLSFMRSDCDIVEYHVIFSDSTPIKTGLLSARGFILLDCNTIVMDEL